MSGDRVWRSVLYVPASNDRAMAKAGGLDADAVIYDLEDSVSTGAKPAARSALAAALDGRARRRPVLIRINGLDTPWGEADLEAALALAPDGLVLPKVASADQVSRVAERIALSSGAADTKIWAMIETCAALPETFHIARAPRMAGLILGTNDLAAELGAEPGPDRMEIMVALQTVLAAARSAGILCLDGVHGDIGDADGLVAECGQARRMGMDGKTLIHPSQIGPANGAFTPTEADADLARRRIAAFEAAEAQGQGVAVLDGRMIEALHLAAARRTLARYAAGGGRA